MTMSNDSLDSEDLADSAFPAGSAHRTGGPWAAGFATAAGVLMITLGIAQTLEGLAALINGDFFLRVGDYAFDVDVTAYGWIHMVLGVAVAVAGGYVVVGALWARMVGIAIALVSALANFLFIPYYPVWAILLVVFNLFVIWALAVYNPAPQDI
jgi:hypothetical protein